MACGSGLTRGTVSLTHRSIEALRPAEAPYRISDQRCIGLAVRVAPSGFKTWDLAYRICGLGKVRRVTPIVGLRLPRELQERAEYWALTHDFNSMSAAYRRLIEIGLRATTNESN